MAGVERSGGGGRGGAGDPGRADDPGGKGGRGTEARGAGEGGGGAEAPVGAGLCDSCAHQQVVRNTRGSAFSLCRRSRTEPDRFPRYPRVPVMRCEGWEAKAS